MAFCKGRGTAGRCGHRPLRKRNKKCNGRATARVAPTKALQEAQWAGDRKGRPYESVTRGTMSGRPQGSPLRMGCRGGRPCPPGPDNATPCRAGPVCPAVECGKNPGRAVEDAGPYGSATRGAVGRADVGIGPYESVTRGAMSGRPQGSPLRSGYKECGEVKNPPFLRPFKIIFSSLLLSMQRMCFSGHR